MDSFPLVGIILSFSCFALSSPRALASQQQPDDENTRLIPDPQVSGAWTLQWTGRTGRTYFVQHSHDLHSWTYLNTIKHGEGAKMLGTSSTGSKYFLRLRHTDIPCVDPAAADFDGDGLNNAAELFWLCDPFLADSDSDGFNDGWEIMVGWDPKQKNANQEHLDPDGDGWDNATEHLYKTNPNLADSDEDGLDDPDDADPNDPTIDWPRASESTRVWIPLTGYDPAAHGAPVALSNTGIALFEKAVWKAGVWKNLEWEKDGPGLGIPDGPDGPEVLSTTLRAIRALDLADDGRILGKAELLFADPYGGDAGAPDTSQHAVQWTEDTNGTLVMELTGLNVGEQIDMATYWSLPKPAGVSPDGILFTSGPGTPASGGTGGASASVEEWRRHLTNQWQAGPNHIFAQQGAEIVPFEIFGSVWMQARNTVRGGKLGVIRIGEDPNPLLEVNTSGILPSGPGYVSGSIADGRVAFASIGNETQSLLLRPASGSGDWRPVPKLAGAAAFNARGEAISHDGRFWQNGTWLSPVSEENPLPTGTMHLHDLNDHGVMLASAGEDAGGSGSSGLPHGDAAGLVVPFEIQMNNTATNKFEAVSELRVAKWENAYGINGFLPSYLDSWISSYEPDAFRIRIPLPDLPEEYRKVFISTTGAEDPAYNDDSTEVPLFQADPIYSLEDSRGYISKPIILVADEFDNRFKTNNLKEDQTHILRLGSQVVFRLGQDNDQMATRLPVPAKRKVRVAMKLLWQPKTANRVAPDENVLRLYIDNILVAKEVYAQAGIDVEFISSMHQVELANVDFVTDGLPLHGEPIPRVLAPEGSTLLHEYATPGLADVVGLFIDSKLYVGGGFQRVAGIAIPDKSELQEHSEMPGAYWHDQVFNTYAGTFLVSNEAGKATLAHELAHVLSLLHLEEEKEPENRDAKRNLMLNPALYLQDHTIDAKRIAPFQVDRMRKSRFTENP